MPSSCVVPLCNSNYKKNGPNIKVYSFPTESSLSRKWIAAIKRDNFTPTKYSKVCEIHFEDSDFITTSKAVDSKTGNVIEVPLKIKRLKQDAVPSKFPNLPAYCSSNKQRRESPESKRVRTECELLSQAVSDSTRTKQEYDKERTFHSLEDLLNCKKFINEKWKVIKNPSTIMFLYIICDPAPKIQYSVVIDEQLQIKAYFREMELKKISKFSLPCSVNNTNDLNDILHDLQKLNNEDMDFKNPIVHSIINILKSLENEDINKDVLAFLIEQLSLLFCNKHAFRYSVDTLIFATLLFTISPQAYRFIRKSNILCLPHPNTLKNLSNSFDLNPYKEQTDNNFLHYIKKKQSLLKSCDKLVILMLDEIHLKEYVDYKGGNIVGMSYNTDSCASSAHVFMIKSVMSKYKDVVHILPSKTLTGDVLHEFLKKIIIGLENIGFQVLCIITDNNSINRKAMSNFLSPPKLQCVYPHPLDTKRPLFFLIDSVHLLKCIRNNWLNQKNPDQCFYYPDFNEGFDLSKPHNFKTASLKTVKMLHELENTALVKFGFKLNFKALAPSNLERQNVNLVLKLFNEFVAQALIQLGDKHKLEHYQDTSDFITLILTWWQISNVKVPNKGSRLNNVYQTPLTYDASDDKMIFLHKILDWLEEWDKMKSTTGMFSRETHSALKQTVDGIIQLCRYCKDELKIEYILPGKFQTDDLESRFGFYRQLAGCQYHISLQQLFECEKKLRLQSALKLKLKTKAFGEIDIIDLKCDVNFLNINSVKKTFNICVETSDLTDAEPYLPVIIYLAGYCMHSVLKRESCSECKEMYLIDKKLDLNINYDFLRNLDRGQLMFPREHIVNIVLYTYIIVNKLCYSFQSEFLKLQNHRQVAHSTALTVLEDRMLQIDELCGNYHDSLIVQRKVVWVAINIFLNNFCKKKNEDNIIIARSKKSEKSSAEKRKLKTLTKE